MYLGVDVGTGSARAAVFDKSGTLISKSSCNITTWNPQIDYYLQSSTDIWESVCKSVKECLERGKINKDNIKGMAFDATCSLVALGSKDIPITLSPTLEQEQNIIVWMDHRAISEADRINKTKHEVLSYVGNVISPEMECPKLLWVKENLPQSWKDATKFFDLTDYLSYRATGEDVRSVCTVTCKWTYQAHKADNKSDPTEGWDSSFFTSIGLGDLVDEKYERIGRKIGKIGDKIGSGLTEKSANELGLNKGTPVGVGVIDAHAGGIGMLGYVSPGTELDLDKRIALIAGTSACHMAVKKDPLFIEGIWGPYYDAMIPDMWLTEGGQSAVGYLIDFIVNTHYGSETLTNESKEKGISTHELLAQKLERLAKQNRLSNIAYLTKELHILPYFSGNRSPRADPTLKGMISGLTLDKQNLPILYLSTIQSLAHGTKHIIDSLNSKGYSIDTIFFTGGFVKNQIFIEQLADITQCKIILPTQGEAVLLGSAVVASVASGEHKELLSAMKEMNKADKIIHPTSEKKLIDYHKAKHTIFLQQYNHQIMYKNIIGEWENNNKH